MVKGFVQSNNELRVRIIKDEELKQSGYIVYLTVLSHKIIEDDKCYPSISVISEESGLSTSTVKRYIKILSDKGFIIVNTGAKGKANNYWFPLEEDFKHTEMSRRATRRKGTNAKGEYDYTKVHIESQATINEEVNTSTLYSINDNTDDSKTIDATIKQESKHKIFDLLVSEYKGLKENYFVKAIESKDADLDVLYNIFVYSRDKFIWLDKNNYVSEGVRFNSHLTYIMNKLYVDELADIQRINGYRKTQEIKSLEDNPDIEFYVEPKVNSKPKTDISEFLEDAKTYEALCKEYSESKIEDYDFNEAISSVEDGMIEKDQHSKASDILALVDEEFNMVDKLRTFISDTYKRRKEPDFVKEFPDEINSWLNKFSTSTVDELSNAQANEIYDALVEFETEWLPF